MKNGLFEVGDIIRGLKDNNYWITNEKMKKAVVVAATEINMLVRIIEHAENIERNGEHYVDNNASKFELIEEQPKDFWEDLEVL